MFTSSSFEKSVDSQDARDAECIRANRLTDAGQYDEAEPMYRALIDADPGDVSAWYNLGACLQGAERFAEAKAAYRQVVALDPGDMVAHYRLAILLERQHRAGDALASHRNAVAIDPDYANAHAAIGFHRMDNTDPAVVETALWHTRRALALLEGTDEPTAYLRHNIGVTLANLDRPGACAGQLLFAPRRLRKRGAVVSPRPPH